MTAPPEATRGSGQEEEWEFKVEAGHVRLDQFLALQSTELTRAQLHRLIVEGQVLLNGRSAKPAQKVRSGDLVSLTIPPPRETGVIPQWMPLTVIYQDSDIVVIDKPAGLSVHPGPGHPDQTLVNGLLARCPDIQGVGGAIRPGIVHRLDKDTSGLMMVAKNHHSHQELSDQIKNRQVNKGYLALSTGTVTPDAGLIDQPIARDPRHRKRMAVVRGGRESRTRYKVLETPPGHSLLELILETGRTHQIRVHLAYLGHPLLGDGVYGRTSPRLDRHFLHAYKLGFQHPRTGEP
ncbi:MAG: RluA family pseudouridine synthase, partial [Chloroflexota bacterium]|nr:RluA family pseudouridine synthase [Chloroflexota bacterium]